MDSIKNFGQKLVLYTSFVLWGLTHIQSINGQDNGTNNKNNFQNNSMSQEDRRRQEAMQAYTTLETAMLNHNTSSRGNPDIQRAISTLEDFLGEELYHGSLAGIQTIPESGRGSIKLKERGYFAGEFFVTVAQIGAGKFEGKNYAYEKFKAESPRDKSFTWTLYANRAGYDGSNPDKTDDRLKEIIAENEPISSTLINVQGDRETSKIFDITYTGNETNRLLCEKRISTHRLPNGGGIEYHILMRPGDYFDLPLADIAIIAGLTEIKYVPAPTTPTPAEVKHDTIRVPQKIYLVPKNNPDTVPPQPEDKDSILYRAVLLGSSTNTKVPGLRLGLQLGKSDFWSAWDIEVGYDAKRIKGAEFSPPTTVEEKENPNMHNYLGHSELTERGIDTLKLDNASISLIYHVGKRKNIGLVAGVNASVLRENYVGKEDRKTWIENVSGQTVPGSFDSFAGDATLNKTSIMFNPQIGARVYIGRFVFGGDWIIPLMDDPHSKYATTYHGLGNVRFSMGLNFGPSKSDKERIAKRLGRTNDHSTTYSKMPASTQSSTGNSNVMYEYVEKK